MRLNWHILVQFVMPLRLTALRLSGKRKSVNSLSAEISQQYPDLKWANSCRESIASGTGRSVAIVSAVWLQPGFVPSWTVIGSMTPMSKLIYNATNSIPNLLKRSYERLEKDSSIKSLSGGCLGEFWLATENKPITNSPRSAVSGLWLWTRL